MNKKTKRIIISFVLTALCIGIYSIYECLNKKIDFKLSTVDGIHYINGNKTDVYSNISAEIGIIKDKYIIQTIILNNDKESSTTNFYAFNKDGTYTRIILPEGFEYVNRYYDINARIEKDSLIITKELTYKSNPTYAPTDDAKVLCNNVKDEDFYEMILKTTYKNQKFSDVEVVSATTVKEYKEKNNITCDNNVN